MEGLGEEVTEGCLENLGLGPSPESWVELNREREGEEDMFGVFAAKSKEVPREAEAQHGCRNASSKGASLLQP